MNEAMKTAWLEISQMMGETTPEELDVFLRTWQRAIQAEREECAKVADLAEPYQAADLIRARGQA
jgi:hypothetical protein